MTSDLDSFDLDDDYTELDTEIYTVVNDPHGPTNTGAGAQVNNYHSVIQNAEPRRRRLNPQAIPDDYVQWLWARFVPPDSFEQAKNTLASPAATVLLSGPPGSGRQTTAHMLLCPPGAPQRSLRHLPTEPDSQGEVLDPAQIADNDLLLLDLSETDHELFTTHQRSLPAFQAGVQHKDARLVIVLPDDQERWLSDQLQRLLVRITPPDPRQVLVHHLTADWRPVSGRDLHANDLDRQLSTMPMGQVARLARLITDVARTPSGPRDFARLLALALPALNNHVIAVTKALTDADGPTRALLLAAAMLEGAPVDVVHYAEQKLLRITQYPPAETPSLERQDLYRRIEDLDATVDDQRRVGFTELEYGDAILTHVWDRYPHLHPQLATWTRQLGLHRALTDDNLSNLAERYTRQSLRTGRINDLLTTAEQWAKNRRNRVRNLAYTALATSATDDRAGGITRQRLYDWAENRNLDSGLAHIIIAICVGALGPSYPDRALVRLRLLSRHTDPALRAEARQALGELAATDNRFFRRALTKITEPGSVDSELFLTLADPHRLTQDSPASRPLIAATTVQSQLIAGWRTAMTAPVLTWSDSARRWLQACADDPRQDALLDVLVAACVPHPDLFANLFQINRVWAASAEEPTDSHRRRRTALEVEHKIDRARGIDFLYSGQRTTAEETGP